MKKNNKRKVDLDKMDEETFKQLEKSLIEKTSKILNKASVDANKFLAPYGLSLALSYKINEEERQEERQE